MLARGAAKEGWSSNKLACIMQRRDVSASVGGAFW